MDDGLWQQVMAMLLPASAAFHMTWHGRDVSTQPGTTCHSTCYGRLDAVCTSLQLLAVRYAYFLRCLVHFHPVAPGAAGTAWQQLLADHQGTAAARCCQCYSYRPTLLRGLDNVLQRQPCPAEQLLWHRVWMIWLAICELCSALAAQ